MPLIAQFAPQYPGAIVVPAHASNVYQPQNHGGVPNKPRGIVLHTPEERADNIEVTPYYFQNAGLEASTHYYSDSDGDIFQMVPEDCAAIANGLKGKPLPSWAVPGTSLNWQTLSIEIEGYAHSIHETMPVGGPQFTALAKWIRHRAAAYGIPLDREHIIGHYQVADNRSDPGAKFPWAALMAALQEDDMWEPCEERSPFFDQPKNQTVGPSNQQFNLYGDFPNLGKFKAVRVEATIDPTFTGALILKQGDGKYAGAADSRQARVVADLYPRSDGVAPYAVLTSAIKWRSLRALAVLR
jgi:N-acetyl-anhydromuramyl-L-alanine amidase AmpD